MMTKVHHQVSQSNWLDGRGLGEELSKIPGKKSAKAHLQKCHQASHQDWPKFEPGNDKEHEVEAIRTSIPELHSAYGQAINPAPRKVEAKVTDRTR